MKITPFHIMLFMGAIVLMANAGLNPMFLFFGAFIFISSQGRRGKQSAQQRRYEQQKKIREAQARAQRRYNPVPTSTNRRYAEQIEKAQQQQKTRAQLAKALPYKTKGVEEYKNYHYEDAIENFEKALEFNDSDVATHFNLACSYSLTEKADKAFEHLDKAVSLGFNDADKINQHDAFAFLRVQDKFEAFKNNGYRIPSNQKAAKNIQQSQGSSDNLLEELKRLAEKRQEGLMSEEEFLLEKRKLLS